MMASMSFTRVGEQPACPSDKAEKLAEDLRQLKKIRKRSNARDRDTQPSPAHSSVIHIIYDSEGRRITKYPRRERRCSMLKGVSHVHVSVYSEVYSQIL